MYRYTTRKVDKITTHYIACKHMSKEQNLNECHLSILLLHPIRLLLRLSTPLKFKCPLAHCLIPSILPYTTAVNDTGSPPSCSPYLTTGRELHAENPEHRFAFLCKESKPGTLERRHKNAGTNPVSCSSSMPSDPERTTPPRPPTNVHRPQPAHQPRPVNLSRTDPSSP
jgi:hypothetical protein